MSANYIKKQRFYWLKVLADGLLLAASLAFVLWLRQGSLMLDERLQRFIPVMFAAWLLTTVFSTKFKVLKERDYFTLLQPYWVAALAFVLLLTLAIYFFGWIDLPRLTIFGSIALYLMMEAVYIAAYFLYLKRSEPGRRLPFSLVFFFVELLAVTAAFFLIYFSKQETFILEDRYLLMLLGLYFAWLLVSLLVHRFRIKTNGGFLVAVTPFWQSEGLILGLVSFVVFIIARGTMSRLIIFGSIVLFALLENLVVTAYYLYAQFLRAEEDPAEILADELAHPLGAKTVEEQEDAEEAVREKYIYHDNEDAQEILRKKLERLFLKKYGEVYEFLKKHVDLRRFDILSSAFMFAGDTENIDIMEDESLGFFFNFEKANNFRFFNQMLIVLNQKMKTGGVLVGCFESLDQRKQRIFKKFPGWFNRFFYIVDFIYKRIMPKLPFLKKIYFWISRGKKRVFSRTEVLGRLYYCGFEVIGLRPIDNIYYFIAKKTKEPRTDAQPSYGPVFRQRRLGKDGKIIHIFKLRTMHPFAEYLHQYIFDKHKLEDSGKIRDDFRITSWGRFFRKTWIDELPMLFNWLRRDLKLIGVRPLSETFFKTYPEDLQKERVKFKPGLIPPYYADMPEGIEEVWESERKYLAKYERHPFLTDFAYFFKALNNILFHHAKSS
jgi:lipopolysaccharide/colanic/teichoic acid biosynthesis glycosyltransferase